MSALPVTVARLCRIFTDFPILPGREPGHLVKTINIYIYIYCKNYTSTATDRASTIWTGRLEARDAPPHGDV